MSGAPVDVGQLCRLLERARGEIVCVIETQGPTADTVVWCVDRLRREEWCEPCCTRADIEDALNAIAARSAIGDAV